MKRKGGCLFGPVYMEVFEDTLCAAWLIKVNSRAVVVG
jgi:hypothetical protein